MNALYTKSPAPRDASAAASSSGSVEPGAIARIAGNDSARKAADTGSTRMAIRSSDQRTESAKSVASPRSASREMSGRIVVSTGCARIDTRP